MQKFNQLFPLWAILLSVAAIIARDSIALLEPAIVPLLAGIMFLMGLTLEKKDFQRIIAQPQPVMVGVILQFVLMPILAITLANMLELSTQLTAGMVLVGSCAGGTASNVIAYLSKGDVALSISMTIASTLIGVVATPFLCAFYLSETIAVDSISMLISILQMVLIPVVAGSLVNHFQRPVVLKIEPALPSIAIVLILIIIAVIVALNAERLPQVGLLTLVAVILHNSLGLAGGFFVSRLFGFNLRQSQTIAIEVGMQNSGLGVALALQYFSATAALPGALFSIWHNISGSLLAARWSRKRTTLDYLLKDQQQTNAEQ
ncbi:MAG: bile acid:sodium symporter family protein [Gammaproteobacteria bacterium]